MPILNGEVSLPDVGADWIFIDLALCKIVNPSNFQKLNQTDCNICYQHFRKNIKVYDLHESVFDNFQSNGSFIEKYNALDDHFSLLELFADLNLRCDVICINWDEFKTIDVFRTIDLYNYFSDIWFPCADNIIVFPRNMTIFIMIRHDGAIYYVKCD